MLDEKIQQSVYDRVSDSLSGLRNVADDYLSALHTKDLPRISQTWITAEELFRQQVPSFQSHNYQPLLLPLFAQFANLNLSLLRDGVLFGKEWGWSSEYHSTMSERLKRTIDEYVAYAQKAYKSKVLDIIKRTGIDGHRVQPFLYANKYTRETTFTVLDFVQLWGYFDPNQFPKPVEIYLDREIYSDPVGTLAPEETIKLPGPPTKPFSKITVWGGDRIDAIQVDYPERGGPGGVASTGRMGTPNSGRMNPQNGGTFSFDEGQMVVAVTVGFNLVVNQFWFARSDGYESWHMGGVRSREKDDFVTISYQNHFVSSIYVHGMSRAFRSADCVVFGYKLKKSSHMTPALAKLLYVSSPSDITIDELIERAVIQRIAKSDLPAGSLSPAWDTERHAYRERRQQRRASG